MSRRVLTQSEIMRAAAAVADAEGLDAVTVTRVATSLGVTPQALYKHVQGREGLIQLLATRAVLEATKVMSAAVAGRSGREAVRAGAGAFRDYALQHPGVWDATLPRPTGGPAPTALQVAAHYRLHEVFQAMLRAWPHVGAMQKIDVIRGLQAGLHGFLLIERAGGFTPERLVAPSFDALVTALISGLGEPAG